VLKTAYDKGVRQALRDTGWLMTKEAIDPRLLTGPAAGALLGGGVGALAGDDENTLRNALIGAGVGGAGGALGAKLLRGRAGHAKGAPDAILMGNSGISSRPFAGSTYEGIRVSPAKLDDLILSGKNRARSVGPGVKGPADATYGTPRLTDGLFGGKYRGEIDRFRQGLQHQPTGGRL
jgi:hypothetical protein